jgi:succinyl-CoA synthetase beta subunit
MFITRFAQIVKGLKVETDEEAAARQIKALYRLFVDKDCTMVEVRERYR